MRTKIIYFDRRLSPEANVKRTLAARDEVFDRTARRMHRVRWVPTSAQGGYWTDEP